MKCVIPGGNVKVLARALYSLSRIGDEVYMEAANNGIVFHAVNSSRSAYACFRFCKTTFFASFNCFKDVKCKLSIKSFLLAFKSPGSIEKMVDRCSLELNEFSDKLALEVYCKHDLVKIYHLSLLEYEALEAVFEKEDYRNKILTQSRLLLNSIQNFQTFVEEVTVIATRERMIIKNYIDDEPDPNQVIRTELSLEPEEFEDYHLQDEAELTFCLKELRAILSFAESYSLSVLLSFHTAGRPVVFSIQGIPGMEADFVLATLSEQTDSQIGSGTIQTSSVKANSGHHQGITDSGNQNDDICINNNHSDVTKTFVPCNEVVHNKTQVPIPEIADNKVVAPRCHLQQDSEENYIPSTPPAKKFRSKFLGLAQLSQYTSMATDPDEILAEASDNDDN